MCQPCIQSFSAPLACTEVVRVVLEHGSGKGIPCPWCVNADESSVGKNRNIGTNELLVMSPPYAFHRSSTVSFANYGTVLYVNSVESMEDGRFLLSTKGERRFKVHGRGMADGYHTATITFLFDERVTNQDDIGELGKLFPSPPPPINQAKLIFN